MKKLIFDSPVYPIPPSYDRGELDLPSTQKYLEYLENNGAKNVMSTAGTSQFNLLTISEIRAFNDTIARFKGKRILGLPAQSTQSTVKEIKLLNEKKFKDVYLLILFPERYYTNFQLIEFFQELSDVSEYPILLHGNPLKRGEGGIFEYDKQLLGELSRLKNFIGLKEESSTIDFSMNNICDLDLEIIVAGGSMKRYWALQPFGATSFLTGVGSFFPYFAEKFYKEYQKGNLDLAKSIFLEKEKPLFEVFMKIGWHAAMREGLRSMGFIQNDRSPFVKLTDKQIQNIHQTIELIYER